MTGPDTLLRFDFEGRGIRGGIVRLRQSWRAVTRTQEYPEPVRDLLGQALAAAVLLGNIVRPEGSVTLQAQGQGAVNLLLTQCSEQSRLRGLARWRQPLPEAGGLALLSGGRLVITLDPGRGRHRFQGTVALAGASLADALEDYFARSEQIPTRLWLAADADRAAGILLQRVPERGAEPPAEEDWSRVQQLTDTLSAGELLGLAKREVLHRLYHEEDVRLYQQRDLHFECGCNRERIVEVLRSLGPKQVHELSLPDGSVTVDCQFCNEHYIFDPVDVEEVLAGIRAGPGSEHTH